MKPKQERRELEQLYAQIPVSDLPCVEGCADCCGPVPAGREETRRTPKLANSVEMIDVFDAAGVLDWCATCPYVIANNGGCAVYDDRPFMCRLFGNTEIKMLKCPHGRGASKPLNETQTRSLVERYYRLIRKTGFDPIFEHHQKFWKRKRVELGGLYKF